MENKILAILMVFIGVMAVWGIATAGITPQERDEMLGDEEMWP